MSQPLIINNFDTGIGDSQHKGLGLMSRVEIESFPGAVKVQKALSSIFQTAFSQTFIASAGSDYCQVATGPLPVTGTAVYVSNSGGALPGGLAADTVYFIIRIDSTSARLASTIALANAGSQIDITGSGTGTQTMTTVNPGTINYIIKDTRTGVRFLQDSNGRVWYFPNAGTWCYLLYDSTLDTTPSSSGLPYASGNGIVTFRNSSDDGSTTDGTATWLLSFRNASIDIINVWGSTNLETPVWTSGWKTMAGTDSGINNRHHVIIGQDSIIYFTDGKFIGSLKESSGRAFGTGSGSSVLNTKALDVLQGEVLEHLEELGINLLAAGGTYNKIYPWDRVSDSYNLPLTVPEYGIKRLKNIGNIVYILAGTWGNIYTTQGTYIRHFKKIPEQITNNSGTLLSSPITWGGIDAVNGSLIFGAGVQTTGNSGVYLLYPDGRLILDQKPTTGSTNVTAIESSSNFYFIGYASGADQSTTSRYSSYEGIIQSAFYRVATKTEKATYSNLEVVIAKPASSGSIRVSYRTDTSSSFTTLATFTANSTNTTFESDIGLIDIENIQIQAEIDGLVELLEIRLLP